MTFVLFLNNRFLSGIIIQPFSEFFLIFNGHDISSGQLKNIKRNIDTQCVVLYCTVCLYALVFVHTNTHSNYSLCILSMREHFYLLECVLMLKLADWTVCEGSYDSRD